MTDALPWIFALLAAFAGLAAGWMLGNRGVADARRERDALAERFNAAIRDLASASERVKLAGETQFRLDAAITERDEAGRELAALRSQSQERERALGEQFAQLQRMKEQLSVEFSDLAQKVMIEAQGQFLKRADERFNQAGEKNEAQLKALLQPVETTLKQYQEGLQRVEKDRVDSYAGLREAVDQVRVGQSQVKDEAARLVNALRSSPKARGRWGEQSLRNVLEQAGLSPHADFRSEVSVDTDDGRLRPDVIVSLPGGRELVIDAKCSLNAYLDASQEVDDALRIAHLKTHAASIRTHAQQLGAKDYWARFGKAADYVVMYIPGEHFLSAALEQDEALWEWAFERRVLLATPTNLVAICRTVASVWRQEKLADEAQAIGMLGKELYERLAVAAGHLKKVGSGLNNAVNHYNSFVSSFEGRVLVTGRKFRDMNIEAGSRDIELVEGVDALAKEPQVEALPSPAE
ncbi:DNA recombination protein RmuC [Rhizorhapis suberifaciens]|uniref:DNA recombination protein RmuC homolog n=1 Tax=Rhizorhapis suberifaciens TaxID=13656 RepID=A0A840HQT0_9SPHN|nr:DNA recombination protein RmuC [Rhizorhapis suberifaciens]MBB4639958.1 DNA recombination protein RmuC [Rhizorhapis suberifaciens]